MILQDTNGKFIISPNPVSDDFLTIFSNESIDKQFEYTILNILGQKVSHGLIHSEDHQNNVLIGGLPVGLYYINISQEKKSITLPFTIIK